MSILAISANTEDILRKAVVGHFTVQYTDIICVKSNFSKCKPGLLPMTDHDRNSQ